MIPPCLSNCQSLRELKLNLKGHGLVLQPGSFASLVDLNLSDVKLCATFSGGDIGHWISTSCNSLKSLCLDNVLCSKTKDTSISSSSLQQLTIRRCNFPVARKLSITSASLQHLTMSSCWFYEWDDGIDEERLEWDGNVDDGALDYRRSMLCIFTPNLLNFSWTGPPASYTDNLEHFWCLEEANISVDLHHNDQTKEFVCDFLDQLLHSVRYTQNLQINTEVIKQEQLPFI